MFAETLENINLIDSDDLEVKEFIIIFIICRTRNKKKQTYYLKKIYFF